MILVYGLDRFEPVSRGQPPPPGKSGAGPKTATAATSMLRGPPDRREPSIDHGAQAIRLRWTDRASTQPSLRQGQAAGGTCQTGTQHQRGGEPMPHDTHRPGWQDTLTNIEEGAERHLRATAVLPGSPEQQAFVTHVFRGEDDHSLPDPRGGTAPGRDLLLGLAEGRTQVTVGTAVSATHDMVAFWRDRYLAEGLAELADRPRCSRPPVYTQADELVMCQKLREAPPRPTATPAGA